jgi:hypothetical protein
MRIVIVFFILLFAIPVVQVAIDRWIERPGPQVLGGRSASINIAVGKHLRSKDFIYPIVPPPERRAKAS